MNYFSNLLIIKTNCFKLKEVGMKRINTLQQSQVFMIVPFCLKIFYAL